MSNTYLYNATNKNGSAFLTTENLGTGGTLNSQVPVLDPTTGKVDAQFLNSESFIDTKANLDKIPTDTLTAGDKYTVTSDPTASNNHTWIWTGTEWQSYGGGVTDVQLSVGADKYSLLKDGVAGLNVTSYHLGLNLSVKKWNVDDDAYTLGIDAKDATDTQKGMVTLSDATDSASGAVSHVAATPAAVKAAYDLANSKISEVTVTVQDKNGTGRISTDIGDKILYLKSSDTISITGEDYGNGIGTQFALDVEGTKTALGLGTAAYANTGTTSGTIPVLDTNGKVAEAQLPVGSLTQSGIVSLSNATNSTSDSTAATSSAVKAAYDLANSKISGINISLGTPEGIVNDTNVNSLQLYSSTTIDVTPNYGSNANQPKFSLNVEGTKTALGLGSAAYKSTGTTSGTIPVLNASNQIDTAQLPTASTTASGIVQLSDSVTTTSSTTAATSTAVKAAYDLAVSKISGIDAIGSVSDFSIGSFTSQRIYSGSNSITITDTVSNNKLQVKVGLDTEATKTQLGLGTAAYVNTGTTSGTVPVLDAEGKLPVSAIPALKVSEVLTVETADSISAIVAAVNGMDNATVGDLVIVAAGTAAGQYIIGSGTTGAFADADIIELATPSDSIASITLNGKAVPVVNSNATFEAITEVAGDGAYNNIWITTDTAANGNKKVYLYARSANASLIGAVRLSDSATSDNNAGSGLAATPYAVKQAYDLAASKISGITSVIQNVSDKGTIRTENVNTVEFYESDTISITSNYGTLGNDPKFSINVEGTKTALGLGDAAYKTTGTAAGNVPVLNDQAKIAAANLDLPLASTERAGIVRLVDNVETGSSLVAPTTNALKQVADDKVSHGTYNNNTATFTTGDLTTTDGGKYVLDGVVPVIYVILSNGDVCYPGISIAGGKTTLTFWDNGEDRSTVYGGVFATNAGANTHTILLASTTL